MNDRELENLISENMPILDVPESISAFNVISKLNSVSQIRKISVYRRYVEIAAAVMIVIIGMMSYIRTFGQKNSMDMGTMPETEEAKSEAADMEGGSFTDNFDIYEPAEPEAASEIYEASGVYDSSESNSVIDILYITVGEEAEYMIDSTFGKDAEICYYSLDEEYDSDNSDALLFSLVEGDDMTLLKINAVKSGSFTVVIENTCRLTVIVTEG